MSKWLPSRDTQLLPFAQNFSAKITASPTSFGLTTADATSLAAAVTAYDSALATALNPTTRTKSTIAAKDLAKAQMVAIVRSQAKRIQANPSVTAVQKTDLGLPIYPATRTPVPPPGTKPLVNLISTQSRGHVIRLADILTPDKRARPAGVAAAEVYSFVLATPGQEPPQDLEGWRFEGLATKPEFEVDYDAADVGKTAVIVARWTNAKGQPGPVSTPITGTIAA